MEPIVIHTDGGCSGNPGPGGWAFVLAQGALEVIGSGGEANTTNNRMELRAVIEGLLEAERRATGAPVELVTDSQYVKNGITTWIIPGSAMAGARPPRPPSRTRNSGRSWIPCPPA